MSTLLQSSRKNSVSSTHSNSPFLGSVNSSSNNNNNKFSSSRSSTLNNSMQSSTSSTAQLEIPLRDLKSSGIETDEIDIDLTPSNYPWYKKFYYSITGKDQFVGVSRKIFISNPEKNSKYRYCNNYVKTSKYTIITFLPKNLIEQFCRIANVYFLIISAFQLIPGVSPTGRYTTLGPLLVVLAITALKEAFEDYKRHKQDDKVNKSKTLVLRDQDFVEVLWEEIEVGDIVKIQNKQYIPADLFLISTSESSNSCFIETSNLDGETNLKPREALDETAHIKDSVPLMESVLKNSKIHCEHPNNKLYTFSGSIDMNQGSDKIYPIGVKQVLLRGAMLRNTRWINGVVIFSGKDTKLMRNSTGTPSKRSSVERMTNFLIIFIFTFQLLLCGLCAVANGIFTGNHLSSNYLDFDSSSTVNGGMSFLTFLILYNNFIPISLYVSMEVVKVFQAVFINNDMEMYHEESDTPALARTSNLNEELGQVGYIFSDKTGTLTQNKMSFKKCTIAGIRYGETNTTNNKPTVASEDQSSSHTMAHTFSHIDFKDPDLATNLMVHQTSSVIREFLVVLAVCHTVVAENEDGNIIYQASSPDESALVHAAKYFGFEFIQRTNKMITISIKGQEFRYELLNILEFTSDRRRMSVIVRTPEGMITLFCKGADSVIFERLAPSQPYADNTITHLQDFASSGLRTLCIAKSELSESVYSAWSQSYYTASTAIQDREEQISAVADQIERNLFLLGATAIEDKLQVGVPETIQLLREAGIKLWVLTGDKQETAINIGFACELLTPGMDLIVINENTKENCIIEINRKLDELNSPDANPKTPMALIIDGNTLLHALDDGIAISLLKLGVKCKSVICCRVSPLQKAQIVNLVKKNMNAITLAIGDGANDVNMIQTAHVGIGISGEEGLQAARSSDYAIAQFRFLARLLLVHGRYSYRRISKLICYCFYKNIALYLTQFCFTIFNGWSGQTYYERLTLTAYNVAWTFFPVLALGILDKDISEAACMKFPKLYRAGIENYHFNTFVFLSWIGNGLYHSVILYALPAGMFYLNDVISDSGRSIGLFEMGTFSYSAVVLTVNIKLALETKRWTWINHLTTWGSIIIYFLWLIIFGKFFEIDSFDVGSDLYSVIYNIGVDGVFFLTIIIVPIIALYRDITWKYVKRSTPRFSKGYHVAQEIDQQGTISSFPSLPSTNKSSLSRGSSFIAANNI